MSLEVKIPALGESINSGVLAKWHVKDGDAVQKDQPLFELETDKITSEGVAEAAGTISLKVTEGTEVKIGEVVAVITEGATAATKSSSASGDAAPPPRSENEKAEAPTQSPAVRRHAAETGIDPATGKG
ncbi:MAG: biotin/lipoyl-containing protein, partial [Cephaloticoccus sp.]